MDLVSGLEGQLEGYLKSSRGARAVRFVGEAEGVYVVNVREADTGHFVCTRQQRYDKTKPDEEACWDSKFKLQTVEKMLLAWEAEDPGDENLGFYGADDDGTDSELDDE